MNRAKVVMSFDDGRMDNYKIVLKILKEKKIPATFNISTAYVDGSIPKSDCPCLNESMSIENVIDLDKQGFEIAGHGDCHKNTIEDIQKGLIKLKEWLNYSQNQKIGFASPHCMLNLEEIVSKRKKLEKLGIFYVRTGVRDGSNIFGRIIRKVAHLTKSTWLYKIGFKHSLEDNLDQFVFHSIPVINKATVKQVKAIINEAVIHKKVCILMFHSIVDDDSPYFKDTWSWDRKKFEALCEWLIEMSTKRYIQLLRMEELAGVEKII